MIISCTKGNNEMKLYTDSIVAGDTISPYIKIVKINFVQEKQYYYDINHDGIFDIKFIYDFQHTNNRNNYLGVMLLHKNIEIARSLDTKNDIINQLPLYDINMWDGSYGFNAINVEWPKSFILNQTIDKSFDWINGTFYFETHSSRDELMDYMEFYSIKNDGYIGLRIKTVAGYLYGWLSYPHHWDWGEDYTIIALNFEYE